MSMQSIDDFEPSSSTAVFSSAISQTKLQQQSIHDMDESENLTTTSHESINVQNEITNMKSDDHATTTECHVNEQNATSTAEEVSTTLDTIEKCNDNEAVSNAPELELISPAPVVHSVPSDDVQIETQTPTSTSSNEIVPVSTTASETIVQADSLTSTRQIKSLRGKAKMSAVVIAAAVPTRQSTRARKPVTTNLIESNDEDEQTPIPTTTTSKKRVKHQPTSTIPESSVQSAEISSEPKGINAGKKRTASLSPLARTSTKIQTTFKGKPTNPSANIEQKFQIKKLDNTTTKIDVETMDKIQAKKARTSANRKPTTTTPETPGDYVRKLRPRK